MTSRQYRNKTQKRTNKSRKNTTRKSLLSINSITWHPRGISKKSINKKDLPSIMKSNTIISNRSRARGNQVYLFPPKREDYKISKYKDFNNSDKIIDECIKKFFIQRNNL